MPTANVNMARALLERGRECWEQGRYDEATRLLSRLLSLRVIPGRVAERAQFYLGDIQLSQGHYSKARRHLAAAIGNGTSSGETHFLMACALEWDEEANVQAAYRHYRRAVQLEPGQPLYSSAYALMRIRRRPNPTKHDPEALRRLRDSFAASPDDQDIVYNYAYGLMEMGRLGEAEVALRRARKRWPGHPAFEGLWRDHQLRRLGQPTHHDLGPSRSQDEVEPVILPFLSARNPSEVSIDFSDSSPVRITLRAALSRVSSKQLSEMGRSLGLPSTSDSTLMRKEIRRALLHPARLKSLIDRLSPGGRKLVVQLTRDDGSAELKKLRIRLDGPSRQGPHFIRLGSESPVRELSRFGLAFLDTSSSDSEEPEKVIIPKDLHRVLRKIVDMGPK